MSKSIKVNTSNVNRYGFRILSEGIELKYFLLNPIMFYNHHRTWKGDKSEMLPIGKWENLRVEKGVLLADPVFDEDDEFAMKIKKKFEKGMLNAASVNVFPIETSDAPKHLLPGQKRPTVTKSELREISIVDIPGNREAVVLSYEDGRIIELTDGKNQVLPIINKKVDMEINFKTIAVALALSENASEGEIISAINSIKKEGDTHKSENEKLKSANEVLMNEKTTSLKLKAEQVVDAAIAAKKIKKTERDDYLKLAEGNLESVEKILNGLSVQKTLADAAGGNGAASKEVTFEQLSKDNPAKLIQMKADDPEQYKALFKAQYGKDPSNI